MTASAEVPSEAGSMGEFSAEFNSIEEELLGDASDVDAGAAEVAFLGE